VDCAYDVVSGGCFAVPPKPVDCRHNPILCSAALDGSVDGVKSPHEYDGATVLPYTDQRYKSESTVSVRAYKEYGHPVVGGGAGAPTGHLKVFFEKMPVIHYNGSTVASGYGTPDPFYVVFIDHDRFTGADANIDPRDEFILIDITGTLPAFIFRRQTDGSFKIVGKADYHAAKNCTQESAFLWRCNGELRIPLLASDLAPFPQPNEDVQPGIGFAVYPYDPNDPTVLGGLPEDDVASTPLLTQLLAYRTHAMSLLFGEPKGFKADFMTWNIRRSSTDQLAGDFKVVSDTAVGNYIGSKTSDKSIVALQESWDKGKMKTLLDAANETRVQAGLGKLYAEGPPDFAGDMFHKAIQTVAGIAIGNDGTNGGIYTLSARPIVDHAFMTFENENCQDCCKGEDCFKAKGVLWTQIQLNPPTPAKTQCVIQRAASHFSPAPPCDQPPSGDEYVDVFNTHLNATNPQLCNDDTTRAIILENLAAYTVPVVPPPLDVIAKLLGAYLAYLQQHDLNCNVSDSVIQDRELNEMNDFINQHTSPDRPAIIMGDFNIDGRQLGGANSQYREIIKRLHIGPLDPKALSFVNNNNYLQADDLANPYPFDFDWDVDHGDLARQRFASAGTTYPSGGECMGTFIGGGSLTATNYPTYGCYFADKADGEYRYDYIFVRPPKQSDDPDFKAADWVVEKGASVDDAWTSRYPSVSGTPTTGNVFSGPPERLSDHKPVFVGLSFAKLVAPPNFHPEWKHTVELRVSAADASNRHDCSGCSTVDPKVYKYYGHVPLGSSSLVFAAEDKESHYCQNHPSVSWPADGCMDNWNWANVMHDGQEKAHFFGSALYDDDSTSGDDEMPLKNHSTQPVMYVFWTNPAAVFLTGWDGQNIGTKYWAVKSTAPIPITTSTDAEPGPTDQVLKFTAVELPPDQQF
jgi:hypothetical protein